MWREISIDKVSNELIEAYIADNPIDSFVDFEDEEYA